MGITPQSNPEMFSGYTNAQNMGAAWQQTAPVTSGGFQRTPEEDAQMRIRQDRALSFEQASEQAEQAFAGIVAPMTLEDIRAREAQTKAGVLQSAEAIYNPQLQREKQIGAGQVSTAEGVVGQRQGFNISTAEQAFVADVQNKVQDRLREVENIKANYISQGNLAAATRADDQIQKLNEFNTNLTIAKANFALQIMSGSREQAQLELAQTQSNLERMKTEQTLALSNEELKLKAQEMATKLPAGKEFKVNGITYIGTKEAAGVDPAFITLSTDDKGYQTAVHKLTGQVLWKSKTPIGQTKSVSNVTVNMPSYGSSPNNVYDESGKFLGTIRYDSKSGKVISQDIQGNPVSFPKNATLVPTKESDDIFGIGK